jgi:hypothetical protein
MHEVSDIATDPSPSWAYPNGQIKELTNRGVPILATVTGEREGVLIKVVIEPATDRIITAYPVRP